MTHVCMDSRASGENMRGAGTAAALKVGFDAVHSPLHDPTAAHALCKQHHCCV